MSQTDGWRRASPWAVLFFLGRLLRGLVKNAAQSIAPAAAALVAFPGTLTQKLVLIAAAAVTLGLTAAILRYLFFRFHVTDDSILIRDGVLTKKQLDIRFERIQGVNTEQNFIYRWLDLVDVEFDTAGSAASEGQLPAVTSEFADELLRRIDGRRAEAVAPVEDVAAAEPLLNLGWRDMIRIGLADGRVLIVFALIGPFFERLGEQVNEYVANYAESAVERLAGFGAATGALIVVGVIVTVALLLASFSIASAFFRYHDFKLTLDGRKMRSAGGLTTSHRVTMDTRKIQRVRLSQGLIYRWLDVFRLAAQQASSSGNQKDRKSFKVPLMTPAFAAAFSRRILAPESGDLPLETEHPAFIRISPRYIVSRVLVVGLLPLAVVAVPAVLAMGAAALVFVAWPLLVFVTARRSWKRLGYLHNEDAMLRRSGLLGYRLDLFLFRKVQRVTVTQSLLQRRRGLAGLQIFLASGSMKLPYLDVDDAKKLRDFIIYKIESSRLAWH